MESIFKNKVWILFILIFSSCQTYHPLHNKNYLNGSVLYNDPLDIKLEFFGDINFHPLNSVERKKIRKIVKNFEGIDAGDLLAYGTTNMNPEYQILLFFKKSKEVRKTSSGINMVLRDTIKNRVMYKKAEGNKTAYLFLEAMGSNKSTQSITNDGLSLIKALSFEADLKEDLNYSLVFEANKDQPNYLLAREELKNAPIPVTDENEWMQFQFLATVNSFMTDNSEYDELIKEFEDSRKNYLKPILDTLLKDPDLKVNNEVLDKISTLSMDTQVVMLNENHWYPKHRKLALKLLKPLKERGYTYLALEALFQDQDTILNDRTFPTFNSGYYTREVYFGHLIRKAIELGFEVLDYENYDKKINRELGQAMNLTRILKENPEAKVFVYAGLDHIIEEPTERGKSMAVHFKEITNINPLTINQVDLVSGTSNELVMLPFEIVKHNKKLQKKPVDLFVINNLESDFNYIFPARNLENTVIEEESLKKHLGEELLVKVYNLNEYKIYRSSSVPILSSIQQVSGEKIEVALPPGNYMLKILAVENDNVVLREISVQ